MVGQYRVSATIRFAVYSSSKYSSGTSSSGTSCAWTSLSSALSASSTPATAPSVPLPLSLGGISITINGVAAPLFFVSGSQINLLVPIELNPGPATLIVTTAQGQKSAALSFTLLPYAPGLFSFSSTGSGAGAFLHPNGVPVGGAAPAKPGEALVIYLTGLGQTNPPVKSGDRVAAFLVPNADVE